MVAWPGVAGRSKGLKNDPGANITHPLLKIVFLFSKVGYVAEKLEKPAAISDAFVREHAMLSTFG